MLAHLKISNPEDNFLVNSAHFSPFFQSEKEVILQDGMEFKIEKAQFAKANQAKKMMDVQVMHLKQV